MTVLDRVRPQRPVSGGRLTVRWRRNWKLVAGLVVGLVALVALSGSSRLSATVSSRGPGADDPVSVDVAGRTPLLDPDVVHAIEVRYDGKAYDRMIDALPEGRREGLRRGRRDDRRDDAAIDGFRLKGNSTLFGIRGFGGLRAWPGEGARGRRATPALPGLGESPAGGAGRDRTVASPAGCPVVALAASGPPRRPPRSPRSSRGSSSSTPSSRDGATTASSRSRSGRAAARHPSPA